MLSVCTLDEYENTESAIIFNTGMGFDKNDLLA